MFLDPNSPSTPTPEAPVRDDLASILSRAADVLERGGWCQAAIERNGAHCAYGALKEAEQDGSALLRVEAGGFFAKVIFSGETACDIPDWNNAPERTQAEVVAAFRKAAALAEEGVV